MVLVIIVKQASNMRVDPIKYQRDAKFSSYSDIGLCTFLPG